MTLGFNAQLYLVILKKCVVVLVQAGKTVLFSAIPMIRHLCSRNSPALSIGSSVICFMRDLMIKLLPLCAHNQPVLNAHDST